LNGFVQQVTELWGFKLTGWVSLNIQRPLAAKLCIRPTKILQVQERARSSLSACQVWWGWGLSLFFFCPFVCPSHFGIGVRADDFAMKALDYRNGFDTVDRKKIVVVHPCPTYSDCRQLATPQYAKMAKSGGFRH